MFTSALDDFHIHRTTVLETDGCEPGTTPAVQ